MVEGLAFPSRIAPCLESHPRVVSGCHLGWAAGLGGSPVAPGPSEPQQPSCPRGVAIL